MTTDCNCKNVTINVCGCCDRNDVGSNTSGGAGGFMTEVILYNQIINAAGIYTLEDDINNYDDVFIVHEYSTGIYRQSTCMPVRCLGESQIVCYGNQADNSYVIYSFEGNNIKVTTANNSYRIVYIIGRKYNTQPTNQ